MEGNVISTLIQTAMDDENAQRQDRSEKLELYKGAAINALRNALGEDLWAELLTYMHFELESSGRDYFCLYAKIEKALLLELAPFLFLVKSSRSFTSEHHDFSISISLYTSMRYVPIEQLGTVLAAARKQFPIWNSARLAEMTNPIANKLSNCVFNGNAQTPESADAAYRQLLNIDPANAEKWHELRDAWEAIYKNYVSQQAEAQRQRFEKEQAFIAYEIALEAYCRAYLDAVSTNRAQCHLLQEELKVTLFFWKLTYALLSEDDGERGVETRTAYVGSDEPDEEGYWTVYEAGEVHKIRFYNIVLIEGPVEDMIGWESVIAGHWTVDGTNGYVICYRPGLDIQKMINGLDWQTFPDAPIIPYITYHWENEMWTALRKRVFDKLVKDQYCVKDVRSIMHY